MCTLIELRQRHRRRRAARQRTPADQGLLGFDIDLRFIKTQCRVSQGNLDREVMSQIGFLKSELVRCGDTI